MNRYILATILACVFTLNAQAQSLFWPKDCPECVSASSSITDDQDAYFVCVYTGAAGKGYASVAADGNLLFESPDNSTANTHIECDASIAADGLRNGTLDVSVAACNTAGEVINIVNKAETDFRCILHAGLASDDIDISGTGWLKAVTDADCSPPNGCRLVADTDVALSISNVLAPLDYSLGGKFTSGRGGVGRTMQSNPYLNTRGFLSAVSTLSTYGSGTSVFNVYSIKGEYKPYYGANTGSGNTVGFVYSETGTVLWGPVTNGLSTAFKTFGSCDTSATACGPEWGIYGVLGKKDERVLVRLTNSAALATTSLQLNGLLYNYR